MLFARVVALFVRHGVVDKRRVNLVRALVQIDVRVHGRHHAAQARVHRAQTVRRTLLLQLGVGLVVVLAHVGHGKRVRVKLLHRAELVVVKNVDIRMRTLSNAHNDNQIEHNQVERKQTRIEWSTTTKLSTRKHVAFIKELP